MRNRRHLAEIFRVCRINHFVFLFILDLDNIFFFFFILQILFPLTLLRKGQMKSGHKKEKMRSYSQLSAERKQKKYGGGKKIKQLLSCR